MPTKAEQYAQMADKVATQLTGSWQEWAGFLTTASRLYKYPFHEQMCIRDRLYGVLPQLCDLIGVILDIHGIAYGIDRGGWVIGGSCLLYTSHIVLV